jgi:predicted dehydrogenase
MKSLVVGLGIGLLYVDVLKKLGFDVVTVDKDATKNPNFTDFAEACASDKFDTVHICTPNFTHEPLFYEYVKSSPKPNSIVFVEKPGFKTSRDWQKACDANVRLMMVKNNQYRSNIFEMVTASGNSNYININWINNNRVPNPGSWFTTKRLAWGGVSRDLMPHLLSYMPMMFPNEYRELKIIGKQLIQRSRFEDLQSSDYGNVNPDGVYDVEDYCTLDLAYENKRIKLIADWRSMREDDVSLIVGIRTKFELGLCPEEAYSNMIKDAIACKDRPAFWQQQKMQDIWIHKMLEELEWNVG